jgi:hypothetical protein
MKNVKKGLIIITIIAAILTSCKKDDDGTQGPVGNADVYGSYNITLNSGDWVSSGAYYYADISFPYITQAIVDRGAVMVYEQASPIWNALPYTWGNLSISYDFGLNIVHIYYANTDGTQTAIPGTRTFRIVCISALTAKAHSNVDWKNYTEVNKTFNLTN